MKTHAGQTRCTICGRQLSNVDGLRRHLLMQHNLSREEVDSMTNNRRALREAMEAEYAAASAGAESVPPRFPPPQGSHYSVDH